MRRAGALALAAPLWLSTLIAPLSAPAFAAEAETYSAKADRAAALIAEAGARLREAGEGENRLAALGEAVTAYEQGLAAIRGGLRILAAREAQLRAEIEAGRKTYRDILGVLLTLGRTPTPAMLTYPLGPVGHARAARLMAAVAPQIEARTSALKDKLDQLREIRARQAAAEGEIRDSLAAMQGARAALAVALRDRSRPPRLKLGEAEIAGAAKSFSAFAAAIRDTGPVGGSDARFADARGKVPPPVVGEVTLRYGEKDESGDPLTGVRVSAPAYALVTAPWSATIRYAGPLPSYGNVVILEPEEGYLIVLAGLARIDRYAGETVFQGEPLGQLGVIKQSSEEFLVEASADQATIPTETLYIELRANGAPADPALWFAFAE